MRQSNQYSEHSRELIKSDIERYFHLPLHLASILLSISEATLKKKCREFGIKRWPYRKKCEKTKRKGKHSPDVKSSHPLNKSMMDISYQTVNGCFHDFELDSGVNGKKKNKHRDDVNVQMQRKKFKTDSNLPRSTFQSSNSVLPDSYKNTLLTCHGFGQYSPTASLSSSFPPSPPHFTHVPTFLTTTTTTTPVLSSPSSIISHQNFNHHSIGLKYNEFKAPDPITPSHYLTNDYTQHSSLPSIPPSSTSPSLLPSPSLPSQSLPSQSLSSQSLPSQSLPSQSFSSDPFSVQRMPIRQEQQEYSHDYPNTVDSKSPFIGTLQPLKGSSSSSSSYFSTTRSEIPPRSSNFFAMREPNMLPPISTLLQIDERTTEP